MAGVRSVGIEIEERYCEIAAKAIEAAPAGLGLEERR
jgi:hypothetical protein